MQFRLHARRFYESPKHHEEPEIKKPWAFVNFAAVIEKVNPCQHHLSMYMMIDLARISMLENLQNDCPSVMKLRNLNLDIKGHK